MGLVLLERDKPTARNRFARFAHMGLGPCKIVGLFQAVENVNLRGASNPATVTLTIGNDTGTATVHF
jgi:hypothetical protein